MAGLRRQSDPDLAEADKRVSLRRLFVHDFLRVEDEQEESAARERIRALDHVPAFLLGVHLVCARRLPGRARQSGRSAIRPCSRRSAP